MAFACLQPAFAANPSFAEALRGANAGDRGAQYIAGTMYLFGDGTRQNIVEGARWLERSARAGLPQASIALANLYDVGQGVPFDPEKAAQMRQQLAQAGNEFVRAQMNYDRTHPGQLDFRRASTLTDLQQYGAALPYAKRAAAAGNKNAQFLLGRAYHFGLGTVVNLAEAARLYRAAAENGLADGAWGLGYMYEWGLGVPVDHAKALVYYDRAAAGGREKAARAAANLRSPDYYQRRPSSPGPDFMPAPDCGGGAYSHYNGAGRCTDSNGNPNPDGRYVR